VFSTAYPYLAGVMDPFEAAVDFKYKTWTYTFSGEELAAKLQAKGYSSIGTITKVTPTYSSTPATASEYKLSAIPPVPPSHTARPARIILSACQAATTKCLATVQDLCFPAAAGGITAG
jgi:hypothetical protein